MFVANSKEKVFFAKGIKKSYGHRKVLNGISVSCKSGEGIAILGPNGAGKTTLFYSLVGLVKQNAGSIYLGCDEVSSLPVHMRARLGIGYLPQEASIFRDLTTSQNILAILEYKIKDKQKRFTRLEELIDMFSLSNVANSMAVSLSGGERRRLEIARCLAADPLFLFLDEPFAGIDPVSIADIKNTVRMLMEYGIGVIITDHNVREALDIVNRSYVIFNGDVICKGDKNEILSNKYVRQNYLGDSFS